MSGKKVSIPTKQKTKAHKVDEWVGRKSSSSGKLKRLTLDLSEELHRAIKRRAVDEGTTMVKLLRSLLEKQFGAQKKANKELQK